MFPTIPIFEPLVACLQLGSNSAIIKKASQNYDKKFPRSSDVIHSVVLHW
jgi:hypothetical protein